MITQPTYTVGFSFNWEVSDSVWEQHSKWITKCIYVVYNEGIEFVLHNT